MGVSCDCTQVLVDLIAMGFFFMWLFNQFNNHTLCLSLQLGVIYKISQTPVLEPDCNKQVSSLGGKFKNLHRFCKS
jgi:hypothetical protein